MALDNAEPAVYSHDRVRRLRVVLALVAAVGVLTLVLAVAVLVDGDSVAAGVLTLVVAALLLGSSGTALRLLPHRTRPAKVATITAAVLCVVSGLALAGTWLAFLLPLLGLGLLFLALIPDEPEATS